MKKFLLPIMVMVTSSAMAQITANDTVTALSNTVYYSMMNGEVKTEALNKWHLAFSVQPTQFPNNTVQGVSVRVNGGNNIVVYKLAAGQTVANFHNTDTTGMYQLTELVNSDSTWDLGAFNIGANPFNPPQNGGPFYGWGFYNASTHNVEHDNRVYIITDVSRSFVKKFFIEKQVYDTMYHVIYANLDNTDSTYVTINKKDFPNRYYAYLNLNTNAVLDLEPAKTDWDIMFTRYRVFLTTPMGSQFQTVAGVLSRKGINTAEINNQDPTMVYYAPNLGKFNTNIGQIGWDWKTFSPPTTYNVADSTTFFVKDDMGMYFKLVFTGFQGFGANAYFFGNFDVTSIAKIKAVQHLEIYPNPANDNLTIKLKSEQELTIDNVQITTLEGKFAPVSFTIDSNGIITLHTSTLQSGVYVVNCMTKEGLVTAKFIKI